MCTYVCTYIRMYVLFMSLLFRCSSLNSSATTTNSLKRISRCVSAYVHTCNGSPYVRIRPRKSVLKCLTASVTKHTLQSHCHEDGACLSNELHSLLLPHMRIHITTCCVWWWYSMSVHTYTCMHTYVCAYKFVFYCACVRFALV